MNKMNTYNVAALRAEAEIARAEFLKSLFASLFARKIGHFAQA